MKKTKMISFYGGPGAGKSTLAYKLAGELKSRHINCELVTEFAKELTWGEDFRLLSNQLFVAATQFERFEKLNGKVDYIITDAPLLLNIPYFKDKRYRKELGSIVENVYNSYENINYFVERPSIYSDDGRKETLDESIKIDKSIKFELLNRHVKFKNILYDCNVGDLLQDFI